MPDINSSTHTEPGIELYYSFTFLNIRREDKMLWTEQQQTLPKFNLILISSSHNSYINLFKKEFLTKRGI
jgi:hypothetical protein